MSGSSVDRVRAALRAADHADAIETFPDGTRSAAEAAASVGCDVAQIVKSIVLRAGDRPVLALVSGARRVDERAVSALLGETVSRPAADWVREATGFAIGGVSPVGALSPLDVLLDRELLGFDALWAAAGSPRQVFRTDGASLLRLTGARVAAFAV